MLKELIIKKNDIVYGETGAGANVTVDTIDDLANGSFAVLTYDGQLISRTGTVGTVANVDFRKPFTLYAMENSLLRSISFIGKGRNVSMGSVSAAVKTLTFDADNFPTSRAEIKPTGLLIQDADRNVHDPKARRRAELPVDDDTVMLTYATALALLIAAVDGVATATSDGNGLITITLDASRNLQFLATGYLEGVSLTTTQALAYASLLTAVEVAVIEREVQAHQGNTHYDLLGSQADMFTKPSLVESGLTYYAYYFQFIHNFGEYVDHGREQIITMGVVSPDSVPGGSDADGTWAALINAMADPTNDLS